MQTLQIAQSELVSSRVAYGCWRLAGPEGSEPSAERLAHGRKAVLAAYEAGYTLFDHADIYGNHEAERLFGQVLKDVKDLRQRIVMTSKCGIRRAGDPKTESPYRYDFSEGHIIWSCEQSLKRLGVERLDIYQLHRPDYLCDPQEVATAFSRLERSGKVRYFGVSNLRPSQLTALQKACPMPLIVNQVQVNLQHLEPFHDGTLDQCVAEKITPMAWSPLAGGRLGTNDPIDMRDADHTRRIRIREALDLIARERQTSRPVVALAWLLKHPSGILPIIGSTDPVRITELAKAPELDLSRDEWYRLMEAALGQRLP
jgi:predicted oxidoreductase